MSSEKRSASYRRRPRRSGVLDQALERSKALRTRMLAEKRSAASAREIQDVVFGDVRDRCDLPEDVLDSLLRLEAELNRDLKVFEDREVLETDYDAFLDDLFRHLDLDASTLLCPCCRAGDVFMDDTVARCTRCVDFRINVNSHDVEPLRRALEHETSKHLEHPSSLRCAVFDSALIAKCVACPNDYFSVVFSSNNS